MKFTQKFVDVQNKSANYTSWRNESGDEKIVNADDLETDQVDLVKALYVKFVYQGQMVGKLSVPWLPVTA